MVNTSWNIIGYVTNFLDISNPDTSVQTGSEPGSGSAYSIYNKYIYILKNVGSVCPVSKK